MLSIRKKFKTIICEDDTFAAAVCIIVLCLVLLVTLLGYQLSVGPNEILRAASIAMGVGSLAALTLSCVWAAYRWNKKFNDADDDGDAVLVSAVSYNVAENNVAFYDPCPSYYEVVRMGAMVNQNKKNHPAGPISSYYLEKSRGSDAVDGQQNVRNNRAGESKKFNPAFKERDLPPNYDMAEAFARKTKDEKFFAAQNEVGKLNPDVVDRQAEEHQQGSSTVINYSRRRRSSSPSSPNAD